MIEFIIKYQYALVPLLTWFGIQLFKLIYDRCETKKWHIERMWGSGGMPSSHSAVVVSLTTLIAKNYGLSSPLFAISGILALITMYDAAGVRREVGKQAKVLNDILADEKLSNSEKLKEMTGHTLVQVVTGAIIGFITGLIG